MSAEDSAGSFEDTSTERTNASSFVTSMWSHIEATSTPDSVTCATMSSPITSLSRRIAVGPLTRSSN